MKEGKFFVFFTIYLSIMCSIVVIVFEYISVLLGKIDNYLLTLTLAIPMFVLMMFLGIIAASELAVVSAFRGQQMKEKEKFMKSLKMILLGIGTVLILIPAIYLIKNTIWIISTGYNGLDIPLGGIIVSSLLVIGTICILSQVYVNVGISIERNNKVKKVKT